MANESEESMESRCSFTEVWSLSYKVKHKRTLDEAANRFFFSNIAKVEVINAKIYDSSKDIIISDNL